MKPPLMQTMLVYSWDRCWKASNAQGSGHSLRDALLSAYQEKHRHYHTIQHLYECLQLFEQHRTQAQDPISVELALWFHDAIYEPTSKSNEQDSAHWAATALSLAGVPSARITQITQAILATQHSTLTHDLDQQLLVDIDLAILGSPPARFAEYEQQIRAEYAWVPPLDFYQQRQKILTYFCQRTPLYRTLTLQQSHETQAKINLKNALGAP